MTLDLSQLDALRALVLGFAFSGLTATAFEALAGRRAGMSLLQTGDGRALASVPLLVATAPFLIIRNAVRPPRFERRPFMAVFASTVVAGLWSLLCGRLVLDAAAVLIGA